MSRPPPSGAFDPETTQLLASAFEKAWEALQASALAADEAWAAATRETLAKAVILAGRRRTTADAKQLADIALAVIAPHGLSRTQRQE